MPRIEPASDAVTVLSNKKDSFWLTPVPSSAAASRLPSRVLGLMSGYGGWTVLGNRILRNLELGLGGHELDMSASAHYVSAEDATWTWGSGVKLRLFLPDGSHVLAVEVSGAESQGLAVKYLLDAGMLAAGGALPAAQSVQAGESFVALQYVPGKDMARMALAWADTRKGALDLAADTVSNFEILADKKHKRLSALLKNTGVKIGDSRLQAGTDWARLSLDGLVVNQWGPGIWAGLPWFADYWGRDTFISLPGALLTSGEFSTAKSILLNFARFQKTDIDSWPNGRIPNRVTDYEVIYNTADGTLWFVLAAAKYLAWSGDKSFVPEIYPAVERALDGALRHQTGADGLLRHGPAETWMDAVGPGGPWTPRDDRACDIQALWAAALDCGARFAVSIGNPEAAVRWSAAAARARESFAKLFPEPQTGLFDRIKPDGVPDASIRPNQLIALAADRMAGMPPRLQAMLPDTTARKAFSELVYPYGVLSLHPKDRQFHPYHEYPPYYPKDAAYHNGVIWTWLAGPAISVLAQNGQAVPAWRLWSEEAMQIAGPANAGGFAELLEAWPRAGEAFPRVSGTAVQAWSLAEFLRSLYEDLAGYSPDAPNNTFTLSPLAGPGSPPFELNLPFGAGFVKCELKPGKRGLDVRLEPQGLFAAPHATVMLPGGKAQVVVLDRARKVSLPWPPAPPSWLFASPSPDPSIPALRPPDYELLGKENAYYPAPAGRTVGYVEKAEVTPGYRYPLDPNFKPGILEPESLSVYDENDAWGFEAVMRSLSDPGWHPEYGFQLTFLALGVNCPGAQASAHIAKKANLCPKDDAAYSRIIYVGEGVEVFGGKGLVAQWVPQPGTPLGFVRERAVRWKLPKRLLPSLAPGCSMTLYCGAQDNWGGGGIGEFRMVKKEAGRWNGGGAATDDGSAPRIYARMELHL